MRHFFNFILVFFLGLISIYFFILISKKYNIKRNNLNYYLVLQEQIGEEKEELQQLKTEEEELNKTISQEKINRNLLWKKKPGEVVLKIDDDKKINLEFEEEIQNIDKKPIEVWKEIIFLNY